MGVFFLGGTALSAVVDISKRRSRRRKEAESGRADCGAATGDEEKKRESRRVWRSKSRRDF